MTQSFISVPIPTTLFLKLSHLISQKKSKEDPVAMVVQALEYFIDNASWKDDLIPSKGFQWKELFIPVNTPARFYYKGRFYEGNFTESSIYSDGKHYSSPNAWVSSITKTSRNVWNDIQLNLNGIEWELAAILRAR